jgi:hypothetical protein
MRSYPCSIDVQGRIGYQRIVFPLLVAIGSAAGKYKGYADAPEPLGPE